VKRVHAISPRRAALLQAAADVERIHTIGTTPRRDVSPGDLAWWEHADRAPLRRLPRGDLPPIAQWLRTLAGGES
jgi:hypothetical protein